MSWSDVDLSDPGGDTLNVAFGKIDAGKAQALRDLQTGHQVGWDVVITNPEEPTLIVHTETINSSGQYKVRETPTYGVGGATDGLVVSILYEDSVNGGGAWSTVGTLQINYDGSGFYTGEEWV